MTGYNDLTPRGGVAYDLFGNGKTAVKINVGRYLRSGRRPQLYSRTNPAVRHSGQRRRGHGPTPTATSSPTATCPTRGAGQPRQRRRPLRPGEQPQLRHAGTRVRATTPHCSAGWGVRPGDWQFGASVQQEVLPRVSVEVGYYRRWLVNFTVTDNLAVTPADFGTFSISCPLDPAPADGGETISGLYNVNPRQVRHHWTTTRHGRRTTAARPRCTTASC